jgi:hypothetical protein
MDSGSPRPRRDNGSYKISNHAVWRAKQAESGPVKYWEIIADTLSKAGWSWGCVSAIDSNGRTIWIADAHRDDGKRVVVRVKTTAETRPSNVTPFVLEGRWALDSGKTLIGSWHL